MLLKNLVDNKRARPRRTGSGGGGNERPPTDTQDTPRAETAPAAQNTPAPRSTFGVRDVPPPKSKQRVVSTKAETYSPTSLQELPPDFLKMVVNAQDSAPEPERHNEGYVHLSSLLRGICPRAVRLTDENPDKPIYQVATGGHRVMWRMGRAAEAHIRESYIKGVKAEGVYGVWKCKCGANSKNGYYDNSWVACGRCRTLPDNYHEYALFDHDAGVVGNPDMLIRIGDMLYIVEIKSMNGDDFDALQAPMPDHIAQGAGYRKLLQESGMPVSPVIIVLYCTKKFKYGSPYKEFHVNVDKPETQELMRRYWDLALSVRQARLNKGLPPRQAACKTVDSPASKACAHCAECWMRN